MKSFLRLLLLAFACTSFAAPSPAAAREKAPAFTVRNVAGGLIRSQDFAGKPLVVDFWATWCGPCRAELPHLSALHRKYAARGLTVLGISVDEQGSPAVRAFVERRQVPFPVAMANASVMESFGPIHGIPTTFFINRRGEIVKMTVGYREPEELEAIVAQLWE